MLPNHDICVYRGEREGEGRRRKGERKGRVKEGGGGGTENEKM